MRREYGTDLNLDRFRGSDDRDIDGDDDVCGAFMENPEGAVDYLCELKPGHDGRHHDGPVSWDPDE